MKKSLLLLGLMVGWVNLSNSQILTILDEQTGEPLQDVSLMSNHPNQIEMTNAEGQIDLDNFKNSSAIQIFLMGYKKEVISYTALAESNLTLMLTPFAFSGDAIIVSASKWGQNSENISARTTYIDQRTLTLQNPQTTADLLGNSGEVFIQKSQLGGGSPMIRGFATNRLLYTVDGVRMNNAIFRGGNIQNVISLDAFAIERTEIVFGPGSVMYGSDAIGAVMSFQTLKPEFSFNDKPSIFGSATTRYATASDEKTVHFDVNVGFKKWAFLTSFTSSEFGDLKMGSFGPDEYLRQFYVQRIDSTDVVITNNDPRIQAPTGYSQFNLMQKIAFKPSKNWKIEYGFHHSETSSYSRYDRHIRYKDGLPRYGEWSYGPQKWIMNNLSIVNNKSAFNYDRFTLRIAHQYFEESRISRDFNKNDREIRTEKVNAYSVNADFYKSIGKRNTISYGAEAVLNDVNSVGIDKNIATGTSVPGASRYPASTWASYGIYVADQIELSEHFIINSGIRYNQYILAAKFDPSFYDLPFNSASINKGAFTGNLGIVYKAKSKWVLNANFSTAFRAPNVDDMGKVFDSEPGSVIVPNPMLESEYAYSGELGVSKVIGEYLKLDITGYYTYLNNAMVRRNYTLNGMDSIYYGGELSQVQAIQNAATATVFGIQTGFSLLLKSGFGISTRFNYQKGEEELDNGTVSPSRHAAPWFGISRLTYNYKALRLELNCQYSGQKTFEDLPLEEQGKAYIYAIDSNGNPYSPAWYSLNLKAAYKINKYFLLSAGIENITDQRYRPYSSGIVATGKNVIFSVKVNF